MTTPNQARPAEGVTPQAPSAPHDFKPNGYLYEARNRKAVAMSAWAQACDFTADDVENAFDDEAWKNLAAMAEVNPPGSQATKNLVVEIMRRNEHARDTIKAHLADVTDPLEGLPKP